MGVGSFVVVPSMGDPHSIGAGLRAVRNGLKFFANPVQLGLRGGLGQTERADRSDPGDRPFQEVEEQPWGSHPASACAGTNCLLRQFTASPRYPCAASATSPAGGGVEP